MFLPHELLLDDGSGLLSHWLLYCTCSKCYQSSVQTSVGLLYDLNNIWNHPMPLHIYHIIQMNRLFMILHSQLGSKQFVPLVTLESVSWLMVCFYVAPENWYIEEQQFKFINRPLISWSIAAFLYDCHLINWSCVNI